MSQTFRHNYAGRVFGRLTARTFVPTDDHNPMWECECECGNKVVVWTQSLRRGMTKSCGCLHKDVMGSLHHGETGSHNGKRSGAYSSWANMMMRCEWMSHPSCESYGKVGIRVDPRWHSFDNFIADMGPRPDKCSIDRIDGAKGYRKENCRWATRREQALNKSSTVMCRYQGEILPVMTLTERLGLSHPAIRSRATRRGNDYIKALQSVGIAAEYPA